MISTGLGTGFLSTRGNEIVDSNGMPVRITAVNWFGLETLNASPDGLFQRNWKDMMDQMKGLGFNAIRLPFSSELLDGTLSPRGIDYGRNPDLQGLSGIQFIDKIVEYAGQLGMRIILDRHRGAAGDGPNGSGLWYDGRYGEQDWISDWEMLAARYKGNPTVIGADLHNEPHASATWGGDSATDWSSAAERAGAAIQAINPDWLIIVEGIERYNNDWYWWGGNLQGVATDPVRLPVGNKLVYSPHDYPNSVYSQPWFNTPDFPGNLHQVFDKQWGYISRTGTAPILLGEFGSKLESDPKDWAWIKILAQTLNGDYDGDGVKDPGAPRAGLSWAWWSWNPNSGDTGGILADDWKTPITAKLEWLETIGNPAFITDRILYGNPGQNDDLAGGAGIDTFFTQGGAGDWTILRRGADIWVVNRGSGEVDHIASAEKVLFQDGALIEAASLASVAPLEYTASHLDLLAAFGLDEAAAWNHLLRFGVREGRAVTFDGLAYIASHADLGAALGANENAGARHFLEFGRFEGRGSTFDGAAYLASHADLRAAFGRDAEAATAHYITHGRAEGRMVTFDGMAYAASYDDLSAVFGTNAAAATRHFLSDGAGEGRKITFDPFEYLASHGDLIEAFGADPAAATRHWLEAGFAEHRPRDHFDAQQYLDNYPDLRAAFGNDLHAATLHFIQSGYAEHRSDHPL